MEVQQWHYVTHSETEIRNLIPFPNVNARLGFEPIYHGVTVKPDSTFTKATPNFSKEEALKIKHLNGNTVIP